MADNGLNIFNEIAREYDLWYEDNAIFLNELNALKLATSTVGLGPGVSIEIGVGSGRFAHALSIGFGIDPAIEPLKISRSRNIFVVQARAEAVPFKSRTFDSVFFITSLCFVDDHIMALREAARVVKKGGLVIVGLIPGESPWGVFYQKKKEEGHKVYRHARFFNSEGLILLAMKEGLLLKSAVSTLFQPPNAREYISEAPKNGAAKGAGFHVLVFINDNA
ncbi:class I SAM-dependent methyltransferase [Dissulfurimicrobium hydrothermale]|uniref:class I SAM-dependent methyltransferase n=1 Tax=Dissulfurimicrobium hydrothermale TaxID=1750598 RepID=UPI001ED9EB54|nr:class I SAM-dependent methyltransferase [Dissulfurimicrobium hydrothermale]UKL12945.1 class I SAM-dependent methyltransferase [Dissulfurimicrobium hydrothermale]